MRETIEVSVNEEFDASIGQERCMECGKSAQVKVTSVYSAGNIERNYPLEYYCNDCLLKKITPAVRLFRAVAGDEICQQIIKETEQRYGL